MGYHARIIQATGITQAEFWVLYTTNLLGKKGWVGWVGTLTEDLLDRIRGGISIRKVYSYHIVCRVWPKPALLSL